MVSWSANIQFSVNGLVDSSDPSPTIPMSDAPLSITITDQNGRTLDQVTSVPSNGTFQYNFESLDVGNYVLNVSYPGDAIYEPVSGSVPLIISKRNTVLRLDITPSNIGSTEAVALSAALDICPIDNPNCQNPSGGFEGAPITFYVGGSAIGVGKTSNGIAEVSITPDVINIPVGSYDVGAVYSGDPSSEASQMVLPKALTIIRSSTHIDVQNVNAVYVNEAAVINGSVVDNSGNGISGVKVSITDSGASQFAVATDSKGNFSFPYTSTVIGPHVLLIEVTETNDYEGAVTSVVVNVSAAKALLRIQNIPQKVSVNQQFKVEGSLVDDQTRKGITGDNVTVVFDGPDDSSTATVPLWPDGRFVFNVSLTTPGNYNVTVTFTGNGQYGQASDTAIVSATAESSGAKASSTSHPPFSEVSVQRDRDR